MAGPVVPGLRPPTLPSGPTETARDLTHWSFWFVLENQRFLDLESTWREEDLDPTRSVATSKRRRPSSAVVSERVLPGLEALLRADEHPEVVSSALVALARATTETRGDRERARRLLREHAGHSNQKVAESALLGLGLLGLESAGDDLAELLPAREGSWLGTGKRTIRQRAFAAHALGLAAGRTEDSEVRARWSRSLVGALSDSEGDSPTFQVAALQALALIELDGERGDALATLLASWIDDVPGRSDLVRTHAAAAAGRAAARAGDQLRAEVIETLVDLAHSRRTHPHVRAGAAIGLGEAARSGNGTADREARRALSRLMKKGQPLESRFARVALAQAASRPASGDQAFPGAADVRRALLQELRTAKSDDIGWTALALGSLEWRLHRAGVATGDRAAVALAKLGRKRRSDDSSAALALGLALAIQGTKGASRHDEHLLDEFDSIADPVRRGFTALALGLARTPALAETLASQIQPSSGQSPLLWNASVGLMLHGERAGRRLEEILRTSTSSFERRAALRALAQVGDADSLAHLLDSAADASEQALLRAAAVDALAALCDPETLPWRDAYSHALPYFAVTPTLNGSGNESGIVERPW